MENRLLLGQTRQELRSWLAELGEPEYRGDQLFQWLHRQCAHSFDQLTNLPLQLRRQLAAVATINPFTVLKRQVDASDDTRKYLLRAQDGALIETVMMMYEHGRSVCVSSQVGCGQACTFCASTIGGFVRNLNTAELVAQPHVFAQELKDGAAGLHSVVFMGMGEPLENYSNLVKALQILHDPLGMNISYRRMTISTCGLIPEIDRLSHQEIPVTLAVSLHAPNNDLRSKLMPINRTYPVEDLIAVCRQYAKRTGRRVSFEYVLIKAVNDDLQLARELAELVSTFPAHVNLIPLNPIPGRPWKRPSREQCVRFGEELKQAGIPTTLRRILGVEIEAACGQLRRREALVQDNQCCKGGP